ncbi:MAG: hypothetical protein FWD35_05450, partial [Oscillospiraceae bacterium]|nr:hypothetical protein [Oscillospiraceae bacterium]
MTKIHKNKITAILLAFALVLTMLTPVPLSPISPLTASATWIPNGMIDFIEEPEAEESKPNKKLSKREQAKAKLLEILADGVALTQKEVEKATEPICSWETVCDAKDELK